VNKLEKDRLDELKEQSFVAMDILNSIRQELEEMGRVRDNARFTKIVDLIDEWRR